jgi:hypothetical protein
MRFPFKKAHFFVPFVVLVAEKKYASPNGCYVIRTTTGF